MGKVYVQVVVHTFCSLGLASVYKSNMAITACDLLYEPSIHRIFPF